MILSVKPTKKLSGIASAPPSKSCTHRAIVISSLASGVSVIEDALISADTRATIEACKLFGANINLNKREIMVEGFGGKPKRPDKVIDAANSGTTLRIMTAVASLCSGWITLTGDESIKRRPMGPMLSALEQLGVRTHSIDGKPPVKVSGPMHSGVCKIRGDVSSQFVSGLLLVSPLLDGETRIELTTDISSRPYIDLTIKMMRDAGVFVEPKEYGFRSVGVQEYKAMKHSIEGDYSSAAFILAAAAITGSDVLVRGLRKDSIQGDKRILQILSDMGVTLSVGDNSVRVLGARLRAIEADMSDTPDLVPVVAALASVAEGRTLLSNVGHLRFKESDRLRAVSTELSKMGSKIRCGEDYLEIEGVSSLRGGRLCGWNDHRIVMALSVAALRAEGETEIDSAESLDVSFPGFVDEMRNIGADISLRNI